MKLIKQDVMNSLSRKFHMTGLKFKKHSPEILLVAGITGAVTSAVMACKATTKIDTILEKTHDDLAVIHEAAERGTVKVRKENGEIGYDPYSEEEAKKDVTIIYAKTGLEFAKLYGPSIVLGAASVVCILASHNIIRKRNVALTAAYAAIDKSFKDYRGRVVERFGKELDRELKYNIKAKEIEETVVNEDGTETVVKKTVEVVDPNIYSDYARFFDDGCTGWDKNPEYSLMFLRQQQNFANDKLKSQGYLFLNDVYKLLGIPQTKAGQVVGWTYDKHHPTSDGFVDFGIWDMYNEKARDFVNGHERVILLEFNVDGDILDYI